MRHALGERLTVNAKVPFVTNDVSLGCDGCDAMLLYGVNAAGKSMTMKAVGLTVLMAQAGMFVACASCDLVPFTAVFTRIGLCDDVRKGHSTFMVEMMELRSILRRADRHSLVIGDELCAGTESASALAIVGAGVKQLSERGVAFVFATHLHELADLPMIRELTEGGLRIAHMSVRCEEGGTLVFDRKLEPGRGLATYGLELCKSLDVGDDFMRTADAIRRHVAGVPPSIVRTRRSRYNANLYMTECAACGRAADHTHHIRHQCEANARGFIEHFHKDRASNLVALCEDCHDMAHDGRMRIDGFRMTTAGVRLEKF